MMASPKKAEANDHEMCTKHLKESQDMRWKSSGHTFSAKVEFNMPQLDAFGAKSDEKFWSG